MEGREKERERNTNVWLPLACPQLGNWPATQACVLTGNQTTDPLVCRPALNPLSHTSQGNSQLFEKDFLSHMGDSGPRLNRKENNVKQHIQWFSL